MTKMKTTILKTLMLVFVVLISACSSDDDSGPNYTEENFLEGYLAATGFDESVENFINSGTYEFGLDFTPLVEGKITTLKVMLPEANPALRITIWDKQTNTVRRTEVVNVATADTEFMFDISDLELVKDNEYAITMSSNDWYNREKTDETNATYPLTVGNIQINAYKWLSTSSQTYPTILSENYYAGDLSFDFIQTE
jgi:hypothetical protein